MNNNNYTREDIERRISTLTSYILNHTKKIKEWEREIGLLKKELYDRDKKQNKGEYVI